MWQCVASPFFLKDSTFEMGYHALGLVPPAWRDEAEPVMPLTGFLGPRNCVMSEFRAATSRIMICVFIDFSFDVNYYLQALEGLCSCLGPRGTESSTMGPADEEESVTAKSQPAFLANIVAGTKPTQSRSLAMAPRVAALALTSLAAGAAALTLRGSSGDSHLTHVRHLTQAQVLAEYQSEEPPVGTWGLCIDRSRSIRSTRAALARGAARRRFGWGGCAPGGGTYERPDFVAEVGGDFPRGRTGVSAPRGGAH